MFTGYLFILLFTTLLYYTTHSGINGKGLYAQQQPIQKVISTTTKEQAFDKWISNQEETSFQMMLNNINPPGTKRGFFAASLSTSDPNYFYTWTRDAALVARVLSTLPHTYDSVLQDYIDFQIDTQRTNTPCDCLGEPKFNPDGSSFIGTWGRPQNDGPAERISTFLMIANRWLENGYKDMNWIKEYIVPAVIRDLDYVCQVWYQPSFDLWEEIEGTHFYTLMVMRKALLDAIDFFSVTASKEGKNEDSQQQQQQQQTTLYNLEKYKLTAYLIEKRIETFWSSQFNYIMATQNVQNGVSKPSRLDVSTLLAANLVASRNDGFFSPGSDKILATAIALEESFTSLYPINSHQQSKKHLSTCIGRYPEDIYDGYGTSVGNPWFLATAAYTELYYLAIQEWKQSGISVNSISRGFFNRMMGGTVMVQDGDYDPESETVKMLVKKTREAADKFLATIQYHQANNGSMSEQYDRYIGYMAGARDLTWSHAAFISASKSRSAV